MGVLAITIVFSLTVQITHDVGHISNPSDRDVLKRLEQEREWLTYGCYGVGSALITGAVVCSPLGLLALPPMGTLLNRLQKVTQIVNVMTVILDEFEKQDVQVIPRLEVPDQQPIDLFVRFPSKEFLIVSIRSLAESKVFYRDDKEALYVRRTKGSRGLKQWMPDPLLELREQESWLRKNRRDLFGGSSRDSRRPLAKVLVLWTTTKLGEHKEDLYDTIGDQKFLTIRKSGTTTVIQREEVLDFIKAYLAFRTARKDQNN